jgi:hypothetical protein
MGRLSMEFDLDWGRWNRNVVAHECGHALTAWVLGSDVEEIAVGPGAYAEFGTELAGYVLHDRPSLSPFHQLCVSLAGTLAEGEPWRVGSWDLNNAADLVTEYYGHAMPDFTRTEYFRRAATKVNDILERWSLALTCLIMKLQRFYKLDCAEIDRTLRRCGVTREISSDS